MSIEELFAKKGIYEKIQFDLSIESEREEVFNLLNSHVHKNKAYLKCLECGWYYVKKTDKLKI